MPNSARAALEQIAALDQTAWIRSDITKANAMAEIARAALAAPEPECAELKEWQDYFGCECPQDAYAQAGAISGPIRAARNAQVEANQLRNQHRAIQAAAVPVQGWVTQQGGEVKCWRNLRALLDAIGKPDRECQWCADGPPEWSYHAKVWIHRRDRLDRRCENPPNNYGYTTQVPDETVSTSAPQSATHYQHYYSTYCIHERHAACVERADELGLPDRQMRCKTCWSPCLCACHEGPAK